MATIKPADFEKEIAAMLQKYADTTQVNLEDAVRETVNAARQRVRELSPVDTDPKEKRRGRYKRGWRTWIRNEGFSVTGIVYNGSLPAITHLLEYGHALRQGGRVSGQPHISTAQDEAAESFEKKLEGCL